MEKLKDDLEQEQRERIIDAAHCSSFMQAYKYALWKYAMDQENRLMPPEEELDKMAIDLYKRFVKK